MNWETERVFFETGQFMDELIDSLRKAEQSFDVEVYIFDEDNSGNRFINELVKAAERGVRVRLLVDGIGSMHSALSLMGRLRGTPVEFRIYHPVFTPFSQLFWWELLHPKRLIYQFAQVNRRNHKKSFVIDKKQAFIGSMNVSDESLSWRETGAMVEGPEVKRLVDSFQINWDKGYAPGHERVRRSKLLDERHRLESSVVRLNYPWMLRTKNHNEFLRKIRTVKKRLWITNPYFVPSLRLAAALKKAAKGGADVRLLLPDKIDIYFIKWVHRMVLMQLLRSGVRVYEYLPAILHAKSTLFDNLVIVGSSNLNHRSLNHDLEVDIELNSRAAMEAFEGQYQRDLARSRQVTEDDLNQTKWFERLLGRFFLLFRNWI